MKKSLLITVIAMCCASPAFAGKHSGVTKAETKSVSGTGAKHEHEHVDAYTKKDGTVVKGHDRSTKDDNKDNNWSTKGNTNPETGKAGTK